MVQETTESKLLISSGSGDNRLMFISDYGTKADIESGYCLSGHDRNTLDSLFRVHKIQLSQSYITSYIKDGLEYYGRAPAKLRKAIYDAENKWINNNINYENILFEEIRSTNPNIIIPLGELSLRKTTEVKGIHNFRGSILSLRPDWRGRLKRDNIRVMPMLGPRELNQNWALRPIAQLDITKIVKYQFRQDPIREEGLTWVCKSTEHLKKFLDRQFAKQPKFMVFDIETIRGIPDCISFCFDGHESVCIPLLLCPEIDLANRILLWQLVARVLRSNIPKVNQNIKYDWRILERFGLLVNNIVGDTSLRAGLIYPEFKKNLGFLVSIYTEMPYFKDEGKDFDIKIHDKNRRYLYNAKDSLGTHRVYEAQESEIEEFGLSDLYYKRIMPLFFIYKSIDDIGLQVDISIREKLIEKYETLIRINQKFLEGLINREINVQSPKQIGILLYQDLKYPARTHQTTEGEDKDSTDEDVLEELLAYHGADNKLGEVGKTVLELIIGLRKFNKVVEYLETVLHPDNRLRTVYNLLGTNTGRTSGGRTLDEVFFYDKRSNKPTRKQAGRSLQTISKHGFRFRNTTYGKDLRDMFVASPGYTFVENDLSAAEARYVAVLSEDWDLLAEFDRAPGIHKLTASWIFNMDPNTIDKSSKEYTLGKMTRHAGNLDIGAFTLAKNLNIDITQATALLKKFHEVSPKTRNIFHFDVKNYVQKNRVLINAFSRRRDFFSRIQGNFYKEVLAYLPQSTISDQNKFAMIPINEELGKHNIHRFVYEGHDALMSEVLISEVERYVEVVKRCVETPIDCRKASIVRDYQLIIPTEFESGLSWGKMEKVKGT